MTANSYWDATLYLSLTTKRQTHNYTLNNAINESNKRFLRFTNSPQAMQPMNTCTCSTQYKDVTTVYVHVL